MGFEIDLAEPGRRRDAALAQVRTLSGAPDGPSILLEARTRLLAARRSRRRSSTWKPSSIRRAP